MPHMWRITTRRLLIATFWFGVATAAILIETDEPYGIVVASMALGYAALSLFETSMLVRSERSALVLMVSVMIGSLILIGAAFAILVR